MALAALTRQAEGAAAQPEPASIAGPVCVSPADLAVMRRIDELKVYVTTFDVALGSWLGQHNACIVSPTCGRA